MNVDCSVNVWFEFSRRRSERGIVIRKARREASLFVTSIVTRRQSQ